MTGSAHTAFAAMAYILGNQARLHRTVKHRDRIDFAIAALELPAEDLGARAAAVDFLRGVNLTPAEAGEGLRAFLDAWAEERLPPAEKASVSAAREAQSQFDWQTRKDCGHD